MEAGFLGFITFEPEVVRAGTTWYVGSGSGNDSATIQGGINLASDGDTVYVYSGTYNENVVVNETINLTGEDRETTVINDMGNTERVQVNANWVNISGFNISGNSLNDGLRLSSDYNTISGNKIYGVRLGINISHSIGNNITDNIMSENGMVISGNGIFIEGDQLEHWNTHYIDTSNTIMGKPIYYWKNRTNGTISLNKGMDAGQVILANCTNVTIEAQFIIRVSFGILLGFSSHNNITGNKIWDSKFRHSIGLYYSSGNNITDNDFYDSWSSDGLYLYYSDRNNISGNTFWELGGDGISIFYSDGNYITDNIFLSNLVCGIYLYYSSDNYIIENNASSNRFGIYLFNSSENYIIGNSISSNEFGIYLYKNSTNNNTIIDNYFTSNDWGIHLYSASFNKISDNYIYQNNFGGIFLHESYNNSITHNNVTSNFGIGIYLWDSLNNLMYRNNVSSNIIDGISLFDSLNNLIYHNNIINNTNQAYDDTNNSNNWDNGYPSGGNYWSDFDESSEGAYDEYNGPDQLLLGSDGIVDNGTIGGGGKNPYVIDSDSRDNYPLIEPNKNFLILKQGWNLISLPLIQQEQSLIKVLAAIDGLYDAVQWYNITDTLDSWKHYKVGKSLGNDLFELNETMGFWIHITPPGDTIFFYKGTQPVVNQNIALHKGWNLVGYPSLNNKDRTMALNNIDFPNDVDSIWTFNSVTQKWEEMGPSEYFELGRGYWVHSKVEKVWEVPL